MKLHFAIIATLSALVLNGQAIAEENHEHHHPTQQHGENDDEKSMKAYRTHQGEKKGIKGRKQREYGNERQIWNNEKHKNRRGSAPHKGRRMGR